MYRSWADNKTWPHGPLRGSPSFFLGAGSDNRINYCSTSLASFTAATAMLTVGRSEMVVTIGKCPTCSAKVSRATHRCSQCGETSFHEVVRRRAGTEPCYDCSHVRIRVDPDCHRCHGFGHVVVVNSYTVDVRTGERGYESRNEHAPDAWGADHEK
jgi:hypothetical protein